MSKEDIEERIKYAKSDFTDGIEILLEIIDQLEQENNKLNKIIDEMAKQLDELQYIAGPDKDCFIPREYSDINDCVRKTSCIECIKQYFEKKVEGK